ncbi:MAG: hypothetical protein NTW86_09635 [Candidatus Sumerlaeota bacterium]|nr:hypothetical protein [Candidatus Sumerlaeota bacterium]
MISPVRAGTLALLAASALAMASSPGGAAHAADSAATALFQQPALAGVAGNFFVKAKPADGAFHLVLWQPNPNHEKGLTIPVDWPVGDKTGFYPAKPWDDRQTGMRNAYGSTAAQIDGYTVGAYLNSEDLTQGSNEFKLMITPQITFPKASRIAPFARPGRMLVCSMDLQVPVASDGHKKGSNVYVNIDLQFEDRVSGGRVSYNGGVFFNGHEASKENIRQDTVTKDIMVTTPLRPGLQFNTFQPGSETHQSVPWKGWKSFQFAITTDHLAKALAAVKASGPGAGMSTNPADYSFRQFHLNAELHYETAPAELGWSMRNAKIELQGE